jgi:hypothetical protein
MSTDLVEITWKSTGQTDIITRAEADAAREAGELVLPEEDNLAMTRDDVYGC